MPKRKKATGQLPSGNYRRKVYVGVRSDGTKRYESFTGHDQDVVKAEASAFRLRVKQLRREGISVDDIPREDVPIAVKHGISLGEAMDAFISTCRVQGYSPSTIPAYKSIRRNAFQQIIDSPVDTLSPHDIQSAIDRRAEDHSIKTIRNEFFFLKKVLSIHAPNLDLSKITIAKRKKRKRQVFRQSWGIEILKCARNISTDMYIYCSFILSAGLRPSEVYALKWDDLTAKPMTMISRGHPIQYGEIVVHRAAVRNEYGKYTEKLTKSEAGNRVLTVDWSFFEDLYSLKPYGTGSIVSMKPNSVSKAWAKVKTLLDLPDSMRYYDLRHFYATSVATSGASEDELKARMGHSTSAFSHDIYVELFEDRQKTIDSALAENTRALYQK